MYRQQSGKAVSDCQDIDVGATVELSLRVSVAALARVMFTNPRDGNTTLALERKATFLPAEGCVTVKAQPFGGALRIENLLPLKERAGGFHFDSQRSRLEQDFRIFIRPAAWGAVRDFCLEQFDSPHGTILESGPDRELAEEFGDILGIDLSPDQYRCHPLWTVLESKPTPTMNVRAESQPTVRIYRVFEVRITDPALIEAIFSNSKRYSNRHLEDLVREKVHIGGKGRANTFLNLPLEALLTFYKSLPEGEPNSLVTFEKCALEPNITTLLDGALAPKYQRV